MAVCSLDLITGKTWVVTFQRTDELDAPIPFDITDTLLTNVYAEPGGPVIQTIPSEITDPVLAKWKFRLSAEDTLLLPSNCSINVPKTLYFTTDVITLTDPVPLIADGQLQVYSGVIG